MVCILFKNKYKKKWGHTFIYFVMKTLHYSGKKWKTNKSYKKITTFLLIFSIIYVFVIVMHYNHQFYFLLNLLNNIRIFLLSLTCQFSKYKLSNHRKLAHYFNKKSTMKLIQPRRIQIQKIYSVGPKTNNCMYA